MTRHQHPPNWTGSSFFGLYPAIVTDIVDPDRLGRVQVSFPWLGSDGDGVRAWATLVAPYADDNKGFVALPEVQTQVVVGFEAGDLHLGVGAVTLAERHQIGDADQAEQQEADPQPGRQRARIRRYGGRDQGDAVDLKRAPGGARRGHESASGDP